MSKFAEAAAAEILGVTGFTFHTDKAKEAYASSFAAIIDGKLDVEKMAGMLVNHPHVGSVLVTDDSYISRVHAKIALSAAIRSYLDEKKEG
jgi:hypothetical protein